MPITTASIEIACPPQVVREKFLDFASLPKYHSSFFTSITPLGPLEPKQKIRIVFVGMGKMEGTIISNKPEAFTWLGSLPYIFSGAHTFHFTPSTKTPGGTTFVQEETFTGALSWLMGGSFVAKQLGDMGKKTEKNWEGYNKDFKKWCETGEGSDA
ncbi:hypothetical protein DE146DRAFT_655063 [Phaeosphaeria sp. MPI-PUGE-AT-0046c]|nr:hypothetical protein DE146DRAFT_655063 [Phaeosphaeria sp. MPI-PUGE-AT-0046c]